jgi:cytoskeletal protein CcmA (bactofilin family)
MILPSNRTPTATGRITRPEMPEDVPLHSNATGVSTIGEDLMISGDVTSTGELHIDGRVEGDVRCASLVLGETSEIKGNVTAEAVMISGRLVGSVRGRRVILQSTAHIEGDVLHKDLAMEQGAFFEGESRRSEDPLSAGEQTAAKPQPERSEGRKDKASSTFVRTLQEWDSI